MVVTYEGQTLHDKGCADGYVSKDISFAGEATNVAVRVIPNCAGTTGIKWNFMVYCQWLFLFFNEMQYVYKALP